MVFQSGLIGFSWFWAILHGLEGYPVSDVQNRSVRVSCIAFFAIPLHFCTIANPEISCSSGGHIFIYSMLGVHVVTRSQGAGKGPQEPGRDRKRKRDSRPISVFCHAPRPDFLWDVKLSPLPHPQISQSTNPKSQSPKVPKYASTQKNLTIQIREVNSL